MKTLLPVSLLLVITLLLAACASEPPRTASGRKLKIVPISHGWHQTTYAYRAVD